MSVSKLISKLDKLLLNDSPQAFEEYQRLIDQLEKIDPTIMRKLLNRHTR